MKYSPNSGPLNIELLLRVGWGLIRVWLGVGWAGALPTPYQPPTNPLSTPNQPWSKSEQKLDKKCTDGVKKNVSEHEMEREMRKEK